MAASSDSSFSQDESDTEGNSTDDGSFCPDKLDPKNSAGVTVKTRKITDARCAERQPGEFPSPTAVLDK